MLYQLAIRVSPAGRVHDFARRKIKSFFWAGLNNSLTEFYLTMSFVMCINLSIAG